MTRHTISVTWGDVSLDGVDVLEVMADADNVVSESNETNNVFTITGPVPVESRTWGMIKAFYR